MFVYTIGDVIFVAILIVLIVCAVSGFAFAVFMDAIDYVCRVSIKCFNNIFKNKGK